MGVSALDRVCKESGYRKCEEELQEEVLDGPGLLWEDLYEDRPLKAEGHHDRIHEEYF